MPDALIWPRGSEWRRWDLHVHTPASLVSHYPGPDPWDSFLTAMAALPPDMSVIGINDYWFVDGYERVLAEKENGNLPNIEAVFPVIELRIDQLAGTEGHLRRINQHVIFEPGFDPSALQAQFVHGLSASFHLDSGVPTVTWSGFPTRENLSSLGAQIRANTPVDKQETLVDSDLMLGFNNLVIPREQVRELLDTPLFKNRALMAVGKAEWASIKWTDTSIGQKKDIINAADFVFVAAASPEDYAKARQALTFQGVLDKLLDCSDAHFPPDSAEKDRLGNCFTWINADPTLAGLRHALHEFDSRVFIGDKPGKLVSVALRPSQHLSKVRVQRHTPSEVDHNYFDVQLELNPGFVAVIGSKGKGKSAILDAIGLAANSSNEDKFSFLNDKRFRRPGDHLAEHYEALVTWCNDETSTRLMSEHMQPTSPERVTYLPQNLIEEICSGDPSKPAARFAAELKSVLFAHVPEAERLGTRDLDSLIQARSASLVDRLAIQREELEVLNHQIVETEAAMRPERKQSIEQRLTLLRNQVADLKGRTPPEPSLPDLQGELGGLRAERDELKTRLHELETEEKTLNAENALLAREVSVGQLLESDIQNLQQRHVAFRQASSPKAESLGLNLDALVQLKTTTEPLMNALGQRDTRRTAIAERISGGEGSIQSERTELEKQVAVIQEQLDRPDKEYTAAIETREAWEHAIRDIEEGTPQADGIRQAEEALADFGQMPDRLGHASSQRTDLVRTIHSVLVQTVAVFEDLYGPAKAFIEGHPLAKQADLEFGATLRVKDLAERLWSILKRNTAGSFQGTDESDARLKAMIAEADFSNVESVVEFVQALDAAVHNDVRDSPPSAIDPTRLLRTGRSLEELYDLVFGLTFLQPEYLLQSSGTPIDQLSPGQKGNLLLMFYLLVDPGQQPLLLDQPDETLDNQTIKDLLVPAIKEAKARRQMIVVTHNPNVAVVADADQIIMAEFDGESFAYDSGAIESRIPNEHIVDVLEGRRPAFENREQKYRYLPT
jgi:ABC-type lipoprotein export system ATPase subunit